MRRRAKESFNNRSKKRNIRGISKKDKIKTKWFHSKWIIDKIEKNLSGKLKIGKANHREEYLDWKT